MKVTKSNLFVSTFASTFANRLFSTSPGETKIATLELCAVPDSVADRQKLEERLGEVQRNVRCVWRAVQLMVFLTAFAIVGIAYSTVLIPDWPQTMEQFLMFWPVKAHCALGCASLSCAFVFFGLGLLYRRELSGLGSECRRLASEVTGSHEARIIPLVTDTRWPGQTAPMDEAA